MGKKHIMVLGAGLVGSLLSTMLAKKGFKVSLYERRPDMRKTQLDGGRSINLALSKRGLKALEQIGIDHKVKKMCIPMHGRMIHDRAGNLQMQPYGMNGEFINSISRAGLNELLMNEAERNGAKIYFGHKCTDVDFDKPEAKFENEQGEVTVGADFIFGADGAFSALRNAYLKTPLFNYSQQYITAGYKELVIPATPDGDFAIASNALHIWPRGSYMLIALPNLDKSFTVTLFFPMKGQTSFETLSHKEIVREFFEREFADATELMPTLVDDFFSNPTSGLVTVRCNPWVKGKTALIGDAAHAIVPFYGQGMNAGFEDCFVLGQLLDKHEDLNRDLLKEYEALRIPDAEAIADLALYNFIEMRDKVADPQFILQKKIEKRLNELYPKKWLPLYPMVTFSDLRYSEAHAIGKKQQAIMDEVLKQPGIANNWQQLDFEAIVEKLG